VLRAARPQATNSGLIEIRVARIGGWVGLASGQTLLKKCQLGNTFLRKLGNTFDKIQNANECNKYKKICIDENNA